MIDAIMSRTNATAEMMKWGRLNRSLFIRPPSQHGRVQHVSDPSHNPAQRPSALCSSHLARAKVNKMVSVDEELKAAKAAKAAIGALLTTTRKSEVLATLSKARSAAVLNLSSGGTLNEARGNVGIALSSVMHSRPTPEKIDKTKVAISNWIRELET